MEVIIPDLVPIEIPPNTVMLRGLGWDSNVYLVRSGSEALIMDTGTGRNAQKYFSAWLREGYLADIKGVIIFNTHEHFDHVGGNREFKELFERQGIKVRFAAHKKTAESIEKGDGYVILDYAYGRRFNPHRVHLKLGDGDILKVGKLRLRLVHTPGHTAGSSCLYLDGEVKLMFTGDTLFNGTAGRTDLPTGNPEEIRESLGKLAEFEVDFGLPGHGWVIKDWKGNLRKVIE